MPPTRSTRTPRRGPSTTASSSKLTLDHISLADVPESITPGYVYRPALEENVDVAEKRQLTEDERAKLIHELVGFNPQLLCNEILEAARTQVYPTIDAIDEWARKSSGSSPKLEMEINTGLVSLETLLESHVDRAFDKFTAWVLRNAFEFSPELEVVLPWQKGLDFARGEYVASQPKGQAGLDETLEALRTKVEQTRHLAQQLDMAEKKLDRRIEIAKQRKAEVGFINEIVERAGLNPLPSSTSSLLPTLDQLYTSLRPLDPLPTAVPTAGRGNEHTKAWELGRAAYLNWALGKVVPSSSEGVGAGEDKLDVLEREIDEITGGELDAERVLGNV